MNGQKVRLGATDYATVAVKGDMMIVNLGPAKVRVVDATLVVDAPKAMLTTNEDVELGQKDGRLNATVGNANVAFAENVELDVAQPAEPAKKGEPQ